MGLEFTISGRSELFSFLGAAFIEFLAKCRPTLRFLRAHLKGAVIFSSNGDEYVGEFENGRLHGNGTYTWLIGNAKYIGQHVMDSRTGWGKMVYEDGAEFEGLWQDGQLVEIGTTTTEGPINLSTTTETTTTTTVATTTEELVETSTLSQKEKIARRREARRRRRRKQMKKKLDETEEEDPEEG